MMYEISYSKQAIKFLKGCDSVLQYRLINKIQNLKEDPVNHDTKIIHGFKEKLYRIRVGNYRILYEIDYQNKLIGVIKIDHREDVY